MDIKMIMMLAKIIILITWHKYIPMYRENGKTNFRPEHRTWAQRLGVQCTEHQAITPDKCLSPILP